MTAPSSRFDLCCLLWAHPGQVDAMAAYEERELALFPDHGIELLERVRGDGNSGTPHEVHLYSIPNQAALDAYLTDPRRTALLDERDRLIARTETFRVTRLVGKP